MGILRGLKDLMQDVIQKKIPLTKTHATNILRRTQESIRQTVEHLTAASCLGVDIGSSAIKVVELIGSNERPILRRAIVLSIENGDPVYTLKKILAEGDFQTSKAALALASPQVIVQPFKFPQMPKKELNNVVHFEAEHAILNGHSPDEMALDWYEHLSSGTATTRGLLAVIPKEMVSNRTQLAKTAGLVPVVVDVEALALWNAYWFLLGSQNEASKTILLVNIGAKGTNLVVAKEPNELILTRDIEIGKTALDSGKASELVSEIHDSLVYARSKFGLRTLDHIYITGGGSDPQTVSLFQSLVKAPVTLWNPFDQLSCNLSISQGFQFAVGIGLALRGLN